MTQEPSASTIDGLTCQSDAEEDGVRGVEAEGPDLVGRGQERRTRGQRNE